MFVSHRTGQAEIYEAGFPDGEIRQLTGGAPVHPFSPAIHPDGERIYFVRGGELWTVERTSLEEHRIVSFPGAQLGECSFGEGGRWLAAAIKQGTECGIAAGRSDGSGWKVIPFARTVIHPQFHPLDPEWIEFAADPAPRMHRVRRDGSRLECLYDHGNDEFVVHETFLGDSGDLVFTVWPRLLCRMDWKTLERTTIAEFNAWHITPDRSGARIVCDTNHPDRGIFLIDVRSGAKTLLCLSESSNRGTQWAKSSYAMAADFEAARSAAAEGRLSWMENSADTVYGPQWTHPHPSFSTDGRFVTFGSDRTGHPQLYVVETPVQQGT